MRRLVRIITCVLVGALVATVSGDYILAWWSGGVWMGDEEGERGRR